MQEFRRFLFVFCTAVSKQIGLAQFVRKKHTSLMSHETSKKMQYEEILFICTVFLGHNTKEG
jgi:hypothetical protein